MMRAFIQYTAVALVLTMIGAACGSPATAPCPEGQHRVCNWCAASETFVCCWCLNNSSGAQDGVGGQPAEHSE